ncbi:MAG: DNA repair protein RadC [Alphaproteobacteria bacterium]|nr:DNA repair protein RadC [Alphaproteobacteria bacterium]MBT4967269.1 DNA repair protein RadC [Alphaproteobacteria bacterium]MBT5160488.1 DNA repair protein RadC [Alphaproteobacteria bacterium]MBT5917442.1 DNA repair protein RadC [Alphaproteobacteria bacterium]
MELILFQAQPRGDVKPLAKSLIKQFGSFAEAVSAPTDRLQEMPGLGEATIVALKSVQAAALKLSQGRVMNKPVLAGWTALVDYCRAAMAYHPTEQFRILFLDRKNVLIADEIQQTGTIDHTPVYPREVVKRALELGASALIMVHNHPSGDPTPSRADIEMTKQVQEAGEKLSIILHDHLIIGRSGETSLKSMGLI